MSPLSFLCFCFVFLSHCELQFLSLLCYSCKNPFYSPGEICKSVRENRRIDIGCGMRAGALWQPGGALLAPARTLHPLWRAPWDRGANPDSQDRDCSH